MIFKIFYYSDVGNHRKVNEDAILIHDTIIQPHKMTSTKYEIKKSDEFIFCIADGMGGHDKGEVASYKILEYIKSHYISNKSFKDWKNLILNSKTYLNEIARSQDSPGMGTTLSSLFFKGTKAQILNIGDSRIYLIRNRKIERITDDHTEVFELFKEGKLSEEEIRTHKRKNILTSAIIADYSESKPNVFEKLFQPKIGDMFLLCTDGLWEGIPFQILEKIFLESGKEDEICITLKDFSLKYAGMDNISFLLLRLVDL